MKRRSRPHAPRIVRQLTKMKRRKKRNSLAGAQPVVGNH
jgi:hypothetical protein